MTTIGRSWNDKPNIKANSNFTQDMGWSFWLGGLPIIGTFYDEALPSNTILYDSSNYPPCLRELLDITCLYKPSLPFGEWINQFIEKTRDAEDINILSNKSHDLHIRGQLESFGYKRREGISHLGYLAGFLACWLCGFVLPSSWGDLVRAEVIPMACNMSQGTSYNLPVPVLAHLYSQLGRFASMEEPWETTSASSLSVPLRMDCEALS
ncbi:hypothetical protein RJ640_008172 [Escallonia rubra]|uniref:Aminotransferase-like plant mobile domain-containing protein n=1 Tax=Escallonia rubra TaxID=112253 RepID=A0AA88SM14_9ASTE|nr:hypothetical protein RJ640_008172 [Escallonia rubra]